MPHDLDFVAIDVETANTDRASICQVGMSVVRGGEIIITRSVFIDPGQRFDARHVQIHGITAEHTAGADTFPRFHAFLARVLPRVVLVAHSSFDREAIAAACLANNLPWSTPLWADSLAAAREAWPDLDNHRLPTLANAIGEKLDHHDAGEDARLAALVMVKACRHMNEPLASFIETWAVEDLPARSSVKPPRIFPVAVAGEGDRSGRMAGQCVAFTGESITPREILAAAAKRAGFDVKSSVTKKCHLLVAAGTAPSGKLKSAQDLLAAGHPIRIVDESAFIDILKGCGVTLQR